MSTADTILQLMNTKGPLLPVHAAKAIGSDILMASAHLSELASRKKVRISKIKVGGSPLYYLPGQEPQLENFSDNLNLKEKEVFDLLKQKKVVRDNAIEPAHRVALRQLKDFAFPLNVSFNNTKELFWKWHTASNEEVTNTIRQLITPPKPEVKGEPPEVQKPKPEVQKQIPVQREATKQKPLAKKPRLEKKIEKPIQKKITKPEPKKIEDELKEEPPKPKDEEIITSPFIKELNKYFSKNNIEIIERNIIRKGSEIDLIVKVPSNVGALTYFCKAKAKKRLNDGDLSSAFIQGQMKKLPVLLLTKGILTKKAQEMLDNEFKGMTLASL